MFHDNTVFSRGNENLAIYFTASRAIWPLARRLCAACTPSPLRYTVDMAKKKLNAAPDLSVGAAPVGSSTSHSANSGEHASAHNDFDSTAKSTVKKINDVDAKITELREQRMRDPDTLGDKAFKVALPAVTGMVAGKLFQTVWDSTTKRIHPSPADDEKDRQNGLLMSVLFAAASAAFGTVVTRYSDKLSQSIVSALQRKRK